jgi:uncharacterized damage-inducible protein DinB
MKRNEKLADELFRSVFKDPWHSASLQGILESISPEILFAKPIKNAHSIVELALHIDAWIQEVYSRLNGNPPADPVAGDWPKPCFETTAYWNSIKKDIYTHSNELIAALKKVSEDKLDQIVGAERNPVLGTGYTYETMIIGLVQHHAYHSGQISILKKFA